MKNETCLDGFYLYTGSYEMSEEVKLRERRSWFGQYREVRFEINQFKIGDEWKWTFYLHLPIQMFPEEIQPKMRPDHYFTAFGTPLSGSYYESPLYDLAWHGGCTYCQIDSTADDPFEVIKMGCDYNHLWDQGEDYTLGEVTRDAKHCIDSLWTKFPSIKTEKELWEAWRSKFPGEKAGDVRRFNRDGTPRKETIEA